MVRATGFPALGSSAVRRPGRSSEIAGPPVALPAPARGFRAGVLSLLYSGDQSASSFLEAFCLFRHLPSPLRLYALYTPRRTEFFLTLLALSSSLFLVLPSPSLSFCLIIPLFLLYSRSFRVSYVLPRRRDSSPTVDKFHAFYVTSSHLSPSFLPCTASGVVEWRGLVSWSSKKISDVSRVSVCAYETFPAIIRSH